jgi:hypothetical protein
MRHAILSPILVPTKRPLEDRIIALEQKYTRLTGKTVPGTSINRVLRTLEHLPIPICNDCQFRSGNCAFGNLRGSESCFTTRKQPATEWSLMIGGMAEPNKLETRGPTLEHCVSLMENVPMK